MKVTAAEYAQFLRKIAPSVGVTKKVLAGEAYAHFGRNLTVRTFNLAYKGVFHRSVGRPRKGNSNEPPQIGTHPPTCAVVAVQPAVLGTDQTLARKQLAPGMVKILANGSSHYQTRDGRTHMAGPDGTFELTEADAMPLLAAGFAKVDF